MKQNRSRIEPGDGDPRHGTDNGYKNLDCRCPACRSAWSASFRRKQMRLCDQLAPDDPRHGLYTTYGNYACRCRPCRDAWAAYKRGWRKRAEAAS